MFENLQYNNNNNNNGYNYKNKIFICIRTLLILNMLHGLKKGKK